MSTKVAECYVFMFTLCIKQLRYELNRCTFSFELNSEDYLVS